MGGTTTRPRLAVHISNRYVYAQVIDDAAGKTLAAASSRETEVKSKSTNVDTAAKVGALIAKRSKAAEISEVVFDRGGHIFHGRIKALADGAREGGLKF